MRWIAVVLFALSLGACTRSGEPGQVGSENIPPVATGPAEMEVEVEEVE